MVPGTGGKIKASLSSSVASSAPAGAHSGKIGPYHFADRA